MAKQTQKNAFELVEDALNGKKSAKPVSIEEAEFNLKKMKDHASMTNFMIASAKIELDKMKILVIEQRSFVTPQTFSENLKKTSKCEVAGYTAEVDNDKVHYKNASGKVAFTDQGNQIALSKERTLDDIRACLELASQKFSPMKVFGDDDFKRQVAHIAAKEGYKIANPEMQKMIEDKREELWINGELPEQKTHEYAQQRG